MSLVMKMVLTSNSKLQFKAGANAESAWLEAKGKTDVRFYTQVIFPQLVTDP